MQIRKELVTEIQHIIAASREAAIRSVDHQRVLMYWHIGKKIFEEEQEAKDRAGYGTYLLTYLAEKLEPFYGSGFSRRQPELCRQFYRMFPIANTLYSQLSWSQYKLLIRIESQEKREFYLAETTKNNWTVRQLERQVNSQLFERLLLSKDVASVLAVARREKQRLLQCFVLVEIKTTRLTHQDLGQLQMYVNYFDRVEKQGFENPTIGILLCADKNDAVVRYSFPEQNRPVVASKYQLYLPSEKQLIEEVKKEIENIEQMNKEPMNDQGTPNPKRQTPNIS